jgi:hypothetical protein
MARTWRELFVGFALGVFGYLLAVLVFMYEGLFSGGADPHDQMAAGLYVALLVGVAPTVIAPIVGWRTRRGQPRRAIGLLTGWACGVVLLIWLFATVHPLLDDLNGHCPCEPLIQQLADQQGP